jgi:Fur family zinc uptake transcriptional regulator
MLMSFDKRALNFCIKNKHRYTKPREKVLKIIASSNKPLRAYDVLKQLAFVLKNPKPPTVYRAIEFWEKYNFIHRIESLNAYSLCEAEHSHEGSQFLICNQCGDVIESHFCEIPKIIKKKIEKNIFIPKSWNLEIKGVCSKCF